jgi:hypothetical protein
MCILLKNIVPKERLTQRSYGKTHNASYRNTEEVVRNLNDNRAERKTKRRGPPPQTKPIGSAKKNASTQGCQ